MTTPTIKTVRDDQGITIESYQDGGLHVYRVFAPGMAEEVGTWKGDIEDLYATRFNGNYPAK